MNTENTMTDKDWDEIDKTSRGIMRQLLSRMSNTISVTDTHGNCCYDLLWIKRDKNDPDKIIKTAVEIKDRTFTHTKYGDILVEELKQDCTQRRMTNGEFERALAVNMFTDKYICIADLYDPKGNHCKRWCDETTMIKGGSKKKVLKDCVELPQTVKIKYVISGNNITFTKEI